MSLLTIPVAIGAMTLGPVAGAILGGDFWHNQLCFGPAHPQCDERRHAAGQPGWDLYYLLCGPRSGGALRRLGVHWLKKLLPKNTKLCCAVGAVATPLLNTFWFMLSLCVFFFNTEYVQSLCATFGTTNPFLFVCAFVGVQALIEAVGCGIVATLVTVPLLKFLKK